MTWVSGAPRLARTGAGQGPLRPSISPLLWIAAGAWSGCWAGSQVALAAWVSGGAVAGGRTAIGAALVLGGAALLWAAFARRSKLRIPAAALALGLAVGALHGTWLLAAGRRIESAGPIAWTGTVCADPVAGLGGTQVPVRLEGAGVSGAVAIVTWPARVRVPEYGRLVSVRARLRLPDAKQEWARAAFLREQIVQGRAWQARTIGWSAPPLGQIAAWRAASLARIRVVGGDGAPLLESMVFGAKQDASGSPAQADAAAAGIGWALVTSGLQLGVLVLVVERAAAILGAGRRGRAAAALLVLAVMTAAAGLRVSLLRAALVASAAVFARVAGRRRDTTAAIGAAVLFLVLVDPPAASDLGLAIGVTAVLAIGLFGGLVSRWLEGVVGRSASRTLGAPLAAQTAVAPLAVAIGGALAPWAPVTLALSLPMTQLAVALGAGGAVVGIAWGRAGEALTAGACRVLSSAATMWKSVGLLPMAQLPVASVPWWAWAMWVAAPVALWWRWPLPQRRARVRIGALALVLALGLWQLAPGTAHPQGPDLVVMDVGQGDAVLVRDSGHGMLVDTGPDPVVLRAALARQGVTSLDELVLTHSHADHVGGLGGLSGVASPSWIGLSDVVDPALDGVARKCGAVCPRVVRLRRGATWTVGDTSVRVLWPTGGERGLIANDTSVVLLLTRGSVTAVLLGDAQERAQLGALAAYSGRVTIMKVAHHGSTNGDVHAALAAWSPKVALISVGRGNSYGHPAPSAVRDYEAAGAKVRRTDLEGDLDVPLDGSPVCDNRTSPATSDPLAARPVRECAWLRPTSPISSRSISCTARRSCCSSAPSGGFATVSRPWPTSTSTWTPSAASRPPPTRSSTPPTRCPS